MTTRPEENELADLLAPYWTGQRTAEALRLDPSELADERSAHRLLGLMTTDGDYFYPVRQFERSDTGTTRVKPGLVRFMEAIEGLDPWTVGVLAVTPAEELDGLTPLQWLDDGRDPGRLIELAHVIRCEFR